MNKVITLLALGSVSFLCANYNDSYNCPSCNMDYYNQNRGNYYQDNGYYNNYDGRNYYEGRSYRDEFRSREPYYEEGRGYYRNQPYGRDYYRNEPYSQEGRGYYGDEFQNRNSENQNQRSMNQDQNQMNPNMNAPGRNMNMPQQSQGGKQTSYMDNDDMRTSLSNSSSMGDSSSDRETEKRISDALSRGWFASNFPKIKVRVSDGVVTITGNVSSPEEKRRVEEDVRKVNGVKSVNNQLNINTQDMPY